MDSIIPGKVIKNSNTAPEVPGSKADQLNRLETDPSQNAPRPEMGYVKKEEEIPFHLYVGCPAQYMSGILNLINERNFIFKGIDPITGRPMFHGDWPGTTHKITAPGSWSDFKLILRDLRTMTGDEIAIANSTSGLWLVARSIFLIKSYFDFGFIPPEYIIIDLPPSSESTSY